MGRRIHVVDVFAEQRLEGNQLAVVIDSDDLGSAEMQAIAREMNYSETTFLLEREPRDGGYDVRIFTPAREIPFAGHPTLGTAFVIRETVATGKPDEIVLNLKVGSVPVRFESGGDGRPVAWMRPPAPDFGAMHSVALAAAAARVEPADVDTGLPIQELSVGISFLFVPLRSLDALRRSRFDLSIRKELPRGANQGVDLFVFTRETHESGNDFAARMFFDANGLREDPATGSANACFAAYLLKHAYSKEGRLDLRVEQGYEIDRPSLLFLRASVTDGVSVGGHVIPVLRGELL